MYVCICIYMYMYVCDEQLATSKPTVCMYVYVHVCMCEELPNAETTSLSPKTQSIYAYMYVRMYMYLYVCVKNSQMLKSL